MTGTAAIAFPGQGGDWQAAVSQLREHGGHPLVQALADRLGTSSWDELDGLDTRNAQPATYVAGLVGPVAEQVRPRHAALAMGHSLGEITAAAWAGAIEPIAGLDLMVARGAIGHAFQTERPGAMVAVNRWDATRVEWLRRSVQADTGLVLDVAVTNSPSQLVLSGDERAVDLATERANDEGAVARRLPIGGAYHSTLMAPAVPRFREQVTAAVTAAPSVPVLSSTQQHLMRSTEDLVDGLTRSLVLAVHWPATVAAARVFGVEQAHEAGPGDTLTRLARFAPELVIVRP